MKFSHLSSFEKHLYEAAPHHLSHVYMVIAPVDFERKKIIETISQAIKPDTSARFDALEAPIERVIAQLNTFSLLGKRPLTIVDGFDKLKKGELESLLGYLLKPSPFAFLILSGSNLKSCQEIYQKAQKEVVLIDLSEEKPWDKEKRLREYLIKEAALKGKTLTPDLTTHLLSQTGPDMACLSQELFKLVSYVGSKSKITLDDAKSICASYHTMTGWQVAENLIWEKTFSIPANVDTSFLISLIGQLRYHLQIGIQISEGTIPYLKSSQVEKFTAFTKKYGISYFKKGLEALFELELAAKSSSIAADLLLEIFIAKLKNV